MKERKEEFRGPDITGSEWKSSVRIVLAFAGATVA